MSMIHPSNLSNQPASLLLQSEFAQRETSSETPKLRVGGGRQTIAINELASRTLIAFRSHAHINNVLTHISGGDWGKAEQALRFIFDPAAEHAELSPLARNILDLMCAERGVTGRILKPFLHGLLFALLEPSLVARTISRLEALYLGVDGKSQETPDAAKTPTNNPRPASQSMSDPHRNERVITVADIDPRYRHMIIFQLFEHLDPDHSVQLVVDHDPKRLRLQFETRHCERCEWTSLEEGPDVWRVRLRVLRCQRARSSESEPSSFSSPQVKQVRHLDAKGESVRAVSKNGEEKRAC
jgi:uncharacterized protein (DUF2249 family)